MNKKIVKLFVLIFGIIIYIIPSATFASVVVNGKEYFDYSSCISGPDPSSIADCCKADLIECPAGIKYSLGVCTQNSDCGNGKVCNTTNKTCVTDLSTGGTPPSVNSQPSIPNTNPVQSPPASSACEPHFTKINGLCVPESNFKGGFLDSTSIGGLLVMIIKFLLLAAGIISVVLVMWGGFQYMTSGGDSEQAEKGKNTVTNAIIGLAIVLLSYTIITLITGTLTKGTLL